MPKSAQYQECDAIAIDFMQILLNWWEKQHMFKKMATYVSAYQAEK